MEQDLRPLHLLDEPIPISQKALTLFLIKQVCIAISVKIGFSCKCQQTAACISSIQNAELVREVLLPQVLQDHVKCSSPGQPFQESDPLSWV